MHACLIKGLLLGFALGGVGTSCSAEEALPPAAEVGPSTENRFPPLQIPDGFTAKLFACDPLIEYPSVIALGPRAGTLLVAHDYVTGLGVEIVRRDEVRLIEDSDADGYADKSQVFAGGFNSIQGLAYDDNTVFVMHAPLLTSLRDTDGDGVADQRHDLIEGLGLPPEENSNRLHCANGVVAAHDGWLYLALGDRGCDVQRPEGDRLLFQQGGILRCRRDGADLHVFATGLRNIYDIALDAELNVFVRDNENDGGDYMVRVCHCFFGSDHGYPYHYNERPDEAMPPLADLGRGSSAGGTTYLETAFPLEYRESLFFCEWGRAVVRYPRARQSSGFEPMKEIDFAAGADGDPYGFKPTDLVVDRDGSLLVSDWCDGQRPKRGRGRIYRISANVDNESKPTSDERSLDELDLPALIQRLDSTSYHHRVAAQLALQRMGTDSVHAVLAATKSKELETLGRLHAIWIIAQAGGTSAIEDLFEIAASDPDTGVRTQAVRAIGDLTDPVLVHDKIESGRGDQEIAQRLAQLTDGADPRITLEVLLVLRRLHWHQTPTWIGEHLAAEDPALDHAAQQALRHARNWPAVMRLLDVSPRMRKLALQALAEQRDSYLATRLIERLASSDHPEHRREYIDALSRIAREEVPWTYWGFRPAPRPAASAEWEKTTEIIAALNESLMDSNRDVRAFALQRMQREGVASDLSRLADWLRDESDEVHVAEILKALKLADASKSAPIFREVVLRPTLPVSNRLTALSTLVEGLPADDVDELLAFGRQLEDGLVLAAVLKEFGNRPQLDATDLLLAKLDSSSADVRTEAIRSLGLRRSSSAREHVVRLLEDDNIVVRQAAAEAAGLLEVTDAADELLAFASRDDAGLVRASLVSLRQLKDARAVTQAIAALGNNETQLAALSYVRDFGTPELVERLVAIAATNPANEFQREVVEALGAWLRQFPSSANEIEHALAKVQGHSGQPLFWQTTGPLNEAAAKSLVAQLTQGEASFQLSLKDHKVETLIADAADASIRFNDSSGSDADSSWLAWSLVQMAEETEIEILTSANGNLSLWLGERRVYDRAEPGAFLPDSDRVSTTLAAGTRMIVAEVRPGGKPARFHLRFRRRSSKAEHERLTQFALQTRGNPSRGGEVFEDIKKSSCLQCHRLGEKGGNIGPDLAGIGSRFSRIHIIESILEPSRTMAPSYATIAIVLNNGRVLSGVRTSEDANKLLLGDNQGKTHEISKADIDEISTHTLSTMPEGLEKRLTDLEFVDLLAFLESQKKLNP
ncbi:MAG TPA: PVC-type heme-binding CxxCH protein [Pirellulaceae bacterium]|nr:PVC-type heme-binding CxxCH protein [Pirellulaceae bacterium]